ncbi:cytochrome oxidase c subunit VIb-domain-containing protein [Schizophyllum amplum]|uniref:Cytochrome oxidase c subunit VIb-domain-containing protein n=1 Tax=Schizophyllum amplum TaxID=97359 RepID=A0A550C6H9_9AGAR|nr:cytochrome oxidase c subunit VIb-domain-containing protein [Auriculariopsis ampla]
MWPFTSSKPAEEAKPTAMTREDRQKCWDSRDAYFACLDKVKVVKAGDEGDQCKAENTLYEKNCARSWIDYFNQRRVIAEAQKERLAQANNQFQKPK